MATLDLLTGSETMDTHSSIHNTERTQINTNTTAIATKQASITGGATTIATDDLTASRALVSDGDGKVAVSDVTATELGKLDGFTGDKDDLNYAKDLRATGVTDTEFDYLDGVTSAIQTQIDGKEDVASTSSSASSATPTPTGSGKRNELYLTALAEAAEFGEPSGTPANGNILLIRVKDNGTARALTYNAIYSGIVDDLPSTTTISKVLYMGFIYNSTSTKWEMIALTEEG